MGTCVGGFVGVAFLHALEWVSFLCLFVQVSVVCMCWLVGGQVCVWGRAHPFEWVQAYMHPSGCICVITIVCRFMQRGV